MTQGPFRNTVLQHLEQASIARLNLRPITLEVGRDLELPGQIIDHIFFVESGVGSMTTMFLDGSQVEVGMFGFESVVGVSALMGARRSLNRIFMQVPGHGFSVAVDTAKREFARFDTFHNLALRYVQAQLTQSMQNAACNASHTQEQRLSRWLLICAERADNPVFQLSQEFVAMMLGSSRPTVSSAINVLKSKGLIAHHRGMIEVLDRVALETQACECYGVVRDHLANYLQFDTGFVV